MRKLASNSLQRRIFRFLLFPVLVFSQPTWAITEPLQALAPLLLDIIVGAALATIIVLIVMISLQKRKVAASKTEAQQHALATQTLQSQVERFVTGVVHLDAQHNVVYANAMAAFYLRKKSADMHGKSLLKVCSSSFNDALEKALNNSKDSCLQTQMGQPPREVMVRIAPQKNLLGNVSVLIAIEDVDDYQYQIDTQRALAEHRWSVMSEAAVLSAQLNLTEQTVQLNAPLAQLLELDEPNISVEQLKSRVDEESRSNWARAMEHFADNKAFATEIRLNIAERSIATQLFGLPHCLGRSDVPTQVSLTFKDLTELNRLTAQRERLRRQVSGLLETSPLPAYLLDSDMKVIECNRAFYTLLSLDARTIKGKPLSSIESLDKTFVALHSDSNLSGIARKPIEISVNDQSIALRVHHFAYRDAENVTGSIGFIEDLTPIKELEHQVAEHKASFAQFMEQSPLGIAVIDDEDQVIKVNHRLTELLSREQSSIEQQTLFQLFKHPEQAGTVARLLHKEGSVKGYMAELVYGNDDVMHTQIDANRLSGDTPRYLLWISDARAYQYVCHQLERLMSFASIPVAIVEDGKFSYLNPAGCAFFDLKNKQQYQTLSPASDVLNDGAEKAASMTQQLERISQQKDSLSFSWVHQCAGASLPCEVTLVPLFRQQQYVATMCLWVDLRAIEQANAARLEAVNLRQAAEREVAEKQQLLESSQDLLANRARSLQDTQDKLRAAEDDLATKMDTIVQLQQAHEDISGHLQSLQNDYNRNRELLAQSEEANTELEAQLAQSSDKVNRLQKQRNDIADALQYSERRHKQAQQELAASEENSQRLKQQLSEQQQSLNASQQQIDSLKQSIDVKDKQISDVSGKINTLQSQLQSSSQTSEKLREQLINQRKASESAEKKRRELELTCQAAQAELSNKASHVEHLQHEMKMLEQMSQQQKGDMEKQTQQLEQELASKQQQLSQTEEALTQARQLSEQEKQRRAEREEEFAKLQKELQDVEQRSAEQQRKIAEADAQWQAQQQALQAELAEKQAALQQTKAQLSDTKQQTEAEQTQHAELLKKLTAELQDVERRAAQQDEKIAQADLQWQQKQQALAEELAAKKAQLETTQSQLNDHQRQVDKERLARKAQQDKLAQLKQEMADVESRATKQREMMAGSDEQWRQHHAEIEQQKQQLQEALEQAQAQNEAMQSTLSDKLEALKSAESTVSKTQSEEQKLQQELNAAKAQADSLQVKLAQQEAQEQQLKQQVAEQQQSLQQREDSIEALQAEQQRLSAALKKVSDEYAQSKASLSDQDSSQQELTAQLQALEAELNDSKQQLTNKESALQQAQQQIASSAEKLAAQEQALVDAQKEELKQVNAKQAEAAPTPKPDFASLPMPSEPAVWFDLLPYLQQRQGVTSLAATLQSLMDTLQERITELDSAVDGDDTRPIGAAARKLCSVLESIHSAPLNDMAAQLQMFCDNGLLDNIAILWPSARQNLMTTLRVIYAHMHAEAVES